MWIDPLHAWKRMALLGLSLFSIAILAGPSSAESAPPTVEWDSVFFDAGDTGTFTIRADPGTIVFVATDVDPGPHHIPRIGLISLGVTPNFFIRRVGITPPSGMFEASCTITCDDAMLGVPIYAQAFAFNPSNSVACLSEPVATMFFDEDGDCDLGAEGCTAWRWTQPDIQPQWPSPYSPDKSFEAIFGKPDTDLTLLEALLLDGSTADQLMREAAAALLNAQDPRVEYPLTPDQVVFLFCLSISDDSASSRLLASLMAYNCLDCTIING